VNDGKAYLEKLCGVDAQVSLSTYPLELGFSSQLTVSLKDNPIDQFPDMQRRMAKERYQLTVYGRKMSSLLDECAVSGVPRQFFYNYQRELYRVRTSYPRSEWASRILELREREPYSQLDSSVLDRIDGVVCP